MSSTKEKDPEMGNLLKPEVSGPPVEKSGSNSGKALSSCALYCFCSVSMVLVNKSLASRSVLSSS